MACPPESPRLHPACLSESELLQSCDVQRGRRGGPGGQHRNKVETAIRLTHDTGVVAEASERRSQAANLEQAIFRLRMKLALAVRHGWSQPSELWQSRSQGGRLRINVQHADLPGLLAESLDALDANEGQDASTAAALGVSRSQLVKFWKRDGAWLEAVNRLRKTSGLSALR